VQRQWILNDIAACGGNPDAVTKSRPLFETEMLVSYAYDSIQRINPVCMLGMVQVLEGTSVAIATQAAGIIRQRLGLPEAAFSYLMSHGSLDQDHIVFFEGLVNQLDDAADQAEVVHSANRFYRLYGAMFDAVQSSSQELKAA